MLVKLMISRVKKEIYKLAEHTGKELKAVHIDSEKAVFHFKDGSKIENSVSSELEDIKQKLQSAFNAEFESLKTLETDKGTAFSLSYIGKGGNKGEIKKMLK